MAKFLMCCHASDEPRIDRQATGRKRSQPKIAPAFFMPLADSRGLRAHLLSESRIVAEIAKATLTPNPKVDWDGWIADYSRIRESIEATYPENFKDFNRRMWQPQGFQRIIAARERKWRPALAKRISSARKACARMPTCPRPLATCSG